jgi:hypothetical protein
MVGSLVKLFEGNAKDSLQASATWHGHFLMHHAVVCRSDAEVTSNFDLTIVEESPVAFIATSIQIA